METGIEIASVICMFIIGLSHILQPRAWVEFFILLRSKGNAGIFIVAFLHMPLAPLIIAFHNRWTGIPALLTVLGWGWTVKAAIYFTFPRVGLFSLARVSHARAHEFVWGGAILVAAAGVLTYSLLRA